MSHRFLRAYAAAEVPSVYYFGNAKMSTVHLLHF